MENQIEQLLSQLTLDEKISLLAGKDLWSTQPIPRLGIPSIKMTDGPLGARGAGGNSSPTAACFPAGVALAATWNTELVERVGAALGQEAKSKGAHILLAPTVNIHRSPLAGRNFECYSEDPYLTAQMAIAYIRGLQSQGTGACIKHFVCNDSEFERQSISSEVHERALQEIYLYPFRVAIQQAHPFAVMSAYNKLNGVWCSENYHLLVEILKEDWGFDGIVISDWYGTYTKKACIGGLDVEMPGPGRWLDREQILQAIDAGEIQTEFLDEKITRILRTIYRVGAFEHPEPVLEEAIDRKEHRELIREASGESIVLLKNSHHALPIDTNKVKSIAVIGANARWASVLGGGSAEVTPHYVVSPLDAIRQRVDGSIKVEWALGCPLHRTMPLIDIECLEPSFEGKRGFQVEIYDNQNLSGEPVRYWFCDRAKITWWMGNLGNVDPVCFSARLRASFKAPETGTYQFGISGNGKYRLWVDNKILVDKWDRDEGRQQPDSASESPAGVALFSGDVVPLMIEYAWEGQMAWRDVEIHCLPPMIDNPIQNAVELASRSDVVIVFAGLTHEWESEGFDRKDMELPRGQSDLIERMASVKPGTIVVLNSGSPVNMPWLDKVSAVLQAWYGGQESGNAIADVLFGDVNPSGKLPTSFPKRLEDNPAFINYPGENGKVYYGEGLFVGYRYYEKKDIAPLFPFGFGLSYTTFEYKNLKISAESFAPGDDILISLEVQNIGNVAGKEVVQLYLRDVESKLVRPYKELKAFTKIFLNPGESKIVQFHLNEEALTYYNDAIKEWIAEPGTFEVLIGASSQDIRIKGTFEWGVIKDISMDARSRLSIEATIGAILDDERGKEVLKKHLPGLADHQMIEMAKGFTLTQIAPFAPDILTETKLKQIDEDLKAL